MLTDGHGGAARSLKLAIIVCALCPHPPLTGAVSAGTKCLQFLRNNDNTSNGTCYVGSVSSGLAPKIALFPSPTPTLREEAIDVKERPPDLGVRG